MESLEAVIDIASNALGVRTRYNMYVGVARLDDIREVDGVYRIV